MNLKPNSGFFGTKRSDTGDQLAIVQEWASERHARCDIVENRVETMESKFCNLVAKVHQLENEYKTAGFWRRFAIHCKISSINSEINENRKLRNVLYTEAWKRS